MDIRSFKSENAWDYENAYNWFSSYSRTAKVISHWELYKKIINLPGDIIEIGVFKGASLLRFATFREILENNNSRKIIGFDSFGSFPITNTASDEDVEFAKSHDNHAGIGLQKEELYRIIEYKNFKNIELVKGNIIETIPDYIIRNTQTRISLLHLDVDVYDPTKFALENLWDRVVTGGIILFDDYNHIEGGTKAIDEFLKAKGIIDKLLKNPYSKVPCYVVK